MAAALRLNAGPRAPNVLVTIRPSIYAENARWALDICGIPYREEHYAPVFSSFGVVRHAGWRVFTGELRQDRASTSLSTPLFITGSPYPGPLLVHKSSSIVAWASSVAVSQGQPSLFPTSATHTLAQHYCDMLGPHTRRLLYGHSDPALFEDTFLRNLGEDSLQWKLLKPWLENVRSYVMRGLGVSPERLAKSRSYVLKEFDKAADLLESQGRLAGRDAHDFLDGGSLSAADIAFSSMAAPVLGVRPWEGFAAYTPPPDALPEEFQTLIRDMRAHPAGAHALRMFRLHRGHRLVPGHPPVPGTTPPHDVPGGGGSETMGEGGRGRKKEALRRPKGHGGGSEGEEIKHPGGPIGLGPGVV